MAKYQRPNPMESFRQASGDRIGSHICGNGPVFDYNAYPWLVGRMPMRPPAACRTRPKSPPDVPRNTSARAALRQQQRMQRQLQKQMMQQQTAQSRCQSHCQSQSQSPSVSHSPSQSPSKSQPQEQPSTLQQPLTLQQRQLQLQQQLHQLQQLQMQLQQEQMRQFYGNWPVARNPVGNSTQIFDPLAQIYNYGTLNPSSCDFWPGYTMVASPDPSIPFAFGLGPTDIN